MRKRRYAKFLSSNARASVLLFCIIGQWIVFDSPTRFFGPGFVSGTTAFGTEQNGGLPQAFDPEPSSNGSFPTTSDFTSSPQQEILRDYGEERSEVKIPQDNEDQASFSIPKWKKVTNIKLKHEEKVHKAPKFRLTSNGKQVTWSSNNAPAQRQEKSLRQDQEMTTQASVQDSKPYSTFLKSNEFFKEKPTPEGFTGASGSKSMAAEISKLVSSHTATKKGQKAPAADTLLPTQVPGNYDPQGVSLNLGGSRGLKEKVGPSPIPTLKALQFIVHDLSLQNSGRTINADKNGPPNRISHSRFPTIQRTSLKSQNRSPTTPLPPANDPARHLQGRQQKVAEEASMVIYQKPKHETKINSKIWLTGNNHTTRQPNAAATHQQTQNIKKPEQQASKDKKKDVFAMSDKFWESMSLFKNPPPNSKKQDSRGPQAKSIPPIPLQQQQPWHKRPVNTVPTSIPAPPPGKPQAAVTKQPFPHNVQQPRQWADPGAFSQPSFLDGAPMLPPHLQSHQLHPVVHHYQTAHAMQQQSEWRPSFAAHQQQPPVILAGPGPMLAPSSYYHPGSYGVYQHYPAYQPNYQPAQSRQNPQKKEAFQPYMYVVEISHRDIDETTGKDGLDGYYQDASNQHAHNGYQQRRGLSHNSHSNGQQHASHGHGHGSHGHSHGSHGHGNQYSVHKSGGQEDSSKQLVLEIFKKKTEVYIETGFEEMAYDHKKWDKKEEKKELDKGYENKEMKSEKKDQGHSSGKYKEEKDHKASSKKKKKASKVAKKGSSKRNKSREKKNNEEKRSSKRGRKKKKGRGKGKGKNSNHGSDSSGSSQEPIFVASPKVYNGTKKLGSNTSLPTSNSSSPEGFFAIMASADSGDHESSPSEHQPVSVYPELAALAPLPPAGAPVAKDEQLPEAEKMVADAEADVDRYERLFQKFEAEQFGKSFLKKLFEPVAPSEKHPHGVNNNLKWQKTPDGGKRYSAQGTVFVPESALPTPLCHLCKNASIVNQFENGTDAGHRLGKATVVSDMLLEKKLPRGRRAIGVEEITEIVKRDPGDFGSVLVPEVDNSGLKDRIKSDRHNGPSWHMKTWDDKDGDEIDNADFGYAEDEFNKQEKKKDSDDDYDYPDSPNPRPQKGVHPHPLVEHVDEEADLLSMNHPIKNHHDPSSKPFSWPHQLHRPQQLQRNPNSHRGRARHRGPSSSQRHRGRNRAVGRNPAGGRSPHHHHPRHPHSHFPPHQPARHHQHRGGSRARQRHRHKSTPRRKYLHQHPRPAPKIPSHYGHHVQKIQERGGRNPPFHSPHSRGHTRGRGSHEHRRRWPTKPPPGLGSRHRQRSSASDTSTRTTMGSSRDRDPGPSWKADRVGRVITHFSHPHLRPPPFSDTSTRVGYRGDASTHQEHHELKIAASQNRPFLLAHVYRAPTQVYRLVVSKKPREGER